MIHKGLYILKLFSRIAWRICKISLFATCVCITFLACFGLFRFPDYEILKHLKETTKLYDSEGNVIREYATVYRESITLHEMGRFPRFAIAAEDHTFQRFWRQWLPIDPRGIVRAGIEDLFSRGKRQGASTITQQSARNVFLESEVAAEREAKKSYQQQLKSGAKGITLFKAKLNKERAEWWRKLRELWVASCIQYKFSNDKILEMYLNSVYFGDGRAGAKSASEHYYGKSPDRLNVGEIAFLVGLIRSPYLSFPEHAEEMKQLRARVLRQFREEGLITSVLEDRCSKLPLPVPRVRDTYADHFAEMIRRRETEQGKFVDQGEKVYTTLDSRLERVGFEALKVSIQAMQQRDPSLTDLMGSVVVIETGQGSSLQPGAIRVDAQYPEFGENEYDLVYQTERHIGSTGKPFFLAALLEKGWRLACDDEGIGPCMLADIPGISVGMGTGRRRKSIQNFHYIDFTRYRGMTPVILAIAESRNAAIMSGTNGVHGSPIQLRVSKEEILAIYARLGIPAPPVDPGLTLPIGSIDVSVWDMARAWTGFMGGEVDPSAIERIAYRDGTIRTMPFRKPQKVFNDTVSLQLMRAMRAAVEFEHGTAKRIRKDLNQQFGAKTGTASDPSGQVTDNWVIVFTPSYVCVVWIGRINKSPIPDTYAYENGKQKLIQNTGSRNALPVASAIFCEMYKDRPKEIFPELTDPNKPFVYSDAK